MTERFDRAHSFVAATDMAAKLGMTTEQAAYGVMDTIMKNNFLAGNFNPDWLRNPKVRLLTLFQGTPFKILEQRLLMAARGAEGLNAAQKELFSKVQQLRSDVTEGQQIFKLGMIKDALNSEVVSKDIFGNPYASQLMRKIMILGTMITGGAQLFDTDLKEHFMHIPGISFEGGKVNLITNPLVSAVVKAKSTDDDFWVSDFVKKWLPSGPIPAIANKIMRASTDDIPEMYKGSTLRYVFRLPPHNKEKD
jgi:hypothetical protein